MPNNPAQIDELRCGNGHPLVIIAGPCVLEGGEAGKKLAFQIAKTLKTACDELDLPLIFKASYDKANRTSLNSYRGIGIQAGLDLLGQIRSEFQVPVTTDIHEPSHAAAAGEICHLLQIPAFLARQTDLLVAAAQTGRAVNVKKGQFMAPWDMRHVVGKLESSGCDDILLTERGTFFGYGQLVNDFTGMVHMRELGTPVVFDATHSVQQPSAAGGKTGGNREMVAPLARAAVAVGCDAIFIETHPEPEKSPSDGPNMVPLDQMSELLKQLVQIRSAITN